MSENHKFSDIFRGYRNGILGSIELTTDEFSDDKRLSYQLVTYIHLKVLYLIKEKSNLLIYFFLIGTVNVDLQRK